MGSVMMRKVAAAEAAADKCRNDRREKRGMDGILQVQGVYQKQPCVLARFPMLSPGVPDLCVCAIWRAGKSAQLSLACRGRKTSERGLPTARYGSDSQVNRHRAIRRQRRRTQPGTRFLSRTAPWGRTYGERARLCRS